MRHGIILLAALLALGCNTVSVKTQGAAGEPITAKGSGAGRGAIELTVAPDGTTKALGCFDATSDWLWLRIIPTMVEGAITAFFGKVNPNPGGITGPSGIGGCDSLFEQGEE